MFNFLEKIATISKYMRIFDIDRRSAIALLHTIEWLQKNPIENPYGIHVLNYPRVSTEFTSGCHGSHYVLRDFLCELRESQYRGYLAFVKNASIICVCDANDISKIDEVIGNIKNMTESEADPADQIKSALLEFSALSAYKI